jgi:hypothetical protein
MNRLPMDLPLAHAQIDWGEGRIVGYSVPPAEGLAFDVVRLLLDGQCVLSSVANRSVFEPGLGLDLGALPLPAREHSAFALRIPSAHLLPGHVGSAGLQLSLLNSGGHTVFKQTLADLHQLLRLTDGVPVDLLYQVSFSHLEGGRVLGSVRDLHGSGARPALLSRLNDHPALPLLLFDCPFHSEQHYQFAVQLPPDQLSEGDNRLQILSPAGQPMAIYPIQTGHRLQGEADRRIAALEAEVAFLKHLVLNPSTDSLPTRLAVLKSEVINICSDMLSLQRIQIEREAAAGRAEPGDGV